MAGGVCLRLKPRQPAPWPFRSCSGCGPAWVECRWCCWAGAFSSVLLDAPGLTLQYLGVLDGQCARKALADALNLLLLPPVKPISDRSQRLKRAATALQFAAATPVTGVAVGVMGLVDVP